MFQSPVRADALEAAEFISQTYRWAQAEEREFGVPASVSLAQAMLESGMGESRLTKEANNWFGIKCWDPPSPWQNGCYSIQTTEYDADGSKRSTTASFRRYDDPERSFKDHGYFLKRLSRYAKAFEHSDNPDRFIVEVHLGGYATDPLYANKVINLMSQHDLYQYNLTRASTGPTELVIRPQTQVAANAEARATGLVSPGGGGARVRTQTWINGRWVDGQGTEVTAGPRGQFSITLGVSSDVPGLVRYRVVAEAATSKTLTSPEFELERLGKIELSPVEPLLVGQPAFLSGSALGYGGSTIIAQQRTGANWRTVAEALVGPDGSFTLPLARTEGSEGSHTYRAYLTTQSGTRIHSSHIEVSWTEPLYAIERWEGPDRFSVSAELSRQGFPTGADTVFLANGKTMVDSLTVGPVAGRVNGPILLVEQDDVPEVVLSELIRLDPKRIVVLGGDLAISQRVESLLRPLADSVQRWSAPDRFAMSAVVSARSFREGVKTVYIANGHSMVDALSVGPLAALEGTPVLLVRQASVPDSVLGEITRLQPDRIVILGGPLAVSPTAEEQLARLAPHVERLSASDRFELSVQVARRLPATESGSVFVANGHTMVDALSAAPVAAQTGEPILLSRHSAIGASVLATVAERDPARVVLLGGQLALSDEVGRALAGG